MEAVAHCNEWLVRPVDPANVEAVSEKRGVQMYTPLSNRIRPIIDLIVPPLIVADTLLHISDSNPRPPVARAARRIDVSLSQCIVSILKPKTNGPLYSFVLIAATRDLLDFWRGLQLSNSLLTVIRNLAHSDPACRVVEASSRMRKSLLHSLAAVTNAGLTSFKPLTIDDFGIIWTDRGLRVGRVEALYSKGGGKNGKHSAVTDHDNISAFSYIGVQVFELAHARNFRAFPTATSFLHTYQYLQLPPFQFLCRLSGKPAVHASGLELTSGDAKLFKELSSAIRAL
ncbi:hypothetical protein MSAN_02332500 [Mycena sanguinolenta]|uniref:Uncharacterized protein n=1 Tax=Mycena sanguinolenta TaxID=230812 RepID=A0A8H7CFW8_9AGAR|nr:hypothetical protein MSAN_02332500 [Mycena sanguinolenta]